MRIIQLIDHFGPGGGLERFVYNLSDQLERVGHQTIIVALSHSAGDDWGYRSYARIQLPDDPDTWSESISMLNPDLIIWHGTPGMAPVVLAVSDNYRVVATVHGVICPSGSRLFSDKDEVCTRKSGLGCLPLWYIRRCGFGKSPSTAVRALRAHVQMVQALNICHRVYAVSEAVKHFLLLEGLREDMIRVFDNTLGAVDTLQQVELCTMRPHDPLHVAYVGRLVYAKGVQYLLRAVAEMMKVGENVTCSIVGEGPYKGTLEKMVKDLGIHQCVRFLGKIPGRDIQDVYMAADVIVVPSIWPDPSPLVVPEARQAGKAVVVSDVGGLPEWATLMTGVFVAIPANEGSLRGAILQAAYSGNITTADEIANKRIDLVQDCMLLAQLEYSQPSTSVHS